MVLFLHPYHHRWGVASWEASHHSRPQDQGALLAGTAAWIPPCMYQIPHQTFSAGCCQHLNSLGSLPSTGPIFPPSDCATSRFSFRVKFLEVAPLDNLTSHFSAGFILAWEHLYIKTPLTKMIIFSKPNGHFFSLNCSSIQHFDHFILLLQTSSPLVPLIASSPGSPFFCLSGHVFLVSLSISPRLSNSSTLGFN